MADGGNEGKQPDGRAWEPLGVSFIRHCKGRKGSKVADTMGRDLSGKRLLAGALIARGLLRKHVISDDESHVGVLLPPSVGGVVINMALALDRRVSVNLNYTVTADVMNSCIEQADIKHILTSRKFMEKVPLEGLNADLVYLEDLMAKVGKVEKLAAAWQAFVTSPQRLAAKLQLDKVSPDDVVTVIFTSGSTGQPKGVMLTEQNVWSNVQAVDEIIRLTPQDVVIGVLPFFHSFGYTITLWLVCGLDIKGAYHFSPLEPRQVGKMCETHQGTILLATPTFLRGYLKRCTPEQLQSIDVVVTGAEKLPSDLADAFEEKFGVRPVEGYGATELSPLAAVNVPPSRTVTDEADSREGTVGRPVPGVEAKVLDLDTGEECATGQSGMLWIKGHNVMKGYLKRDDLTKEVIKDEWYLTGDVAKIDPEGFIQILAGKAGSRRSAVKWYRTF